MKGALFLVAPLALIAGIYGLAQIPGPVSGVGTSLSIGGNGQALGLGDGTAVTVYEAFAGSRAMVGYDGIGAALQGGLGKTIRFFTNNSTFGSAGSLTVIGTDGSLTLGTAPPIGWGASGTADTGWSRISANVVGAGNGTAADVSGTVEAANFVGKVNYIATEGGAANAIAGTLTGSTLAAGLQVNILLAHTLQAGANTFALNGGGAVAIKSHRNTANNIGTAYSSGGIVTLIYDGTQWEDVSQ